MSSRFVSGGAIDAETGEATTPAPAPQETPGDVKKREEWLAVQKDLETERQHREEQRIASAQQPEKSLYEVLQANKGEWAPRPTLSNPFPSPFCCLQFFSMRRHHPVHCPPAEGGGCEAAGRGDRHVDGRDNQRPSKPLSTRRISLAISSALSTTTRSSSWMG